MIVFSHNGTPHSHEHELTSDTHGSTIESHEDDGCKAEDARCKKRVLGFYFYNSPKEPQVIHGVESPGGDNLLAMVNILLKATYSQGAPFVMIQAA